MAGLIITPREEDFSKINLDKATALLRECGISAEKMEAIVSNLKASAATAHEHPLQLLAGKGKQPNVNVGIVSGQKIHFSLNKPYLAKGEMVTGEQEVAFSEGGILWNGNQYSSLTFHPQSADASFSLSDVTIGVNFHWERKETQTFLGTLHFVVESDKICAINELPVERYLESVISSEMSATSSLELLKAHAVISRSWLLAQMKKRREVAESGNNFFSFVKKDDRLIRWYDREDHTIFDVCADDHCQRYQGVSRRTSAATRAGVVAQGANSINTVRAAGTTSSTPAMGARCRASNSARVSARSASSTSTALSFTGRTRKAVSRSFLGQYAVHAVHQ